MTPPEEDRSPHLGNCRICGGAPVLATRQHRTHPVSVECGRCGADTAWNRTIEGAAYWWQKGYRTLDAAPARHSQGRMR